MLSPDLFQLVASDHRQALTRRAAAHRLGSDTGRRGLRASVGLLLVRTGARLAHVEPPVVSGYPAVSGC
jgi:hypothetical protein